MSEQNHNTIAADETFLGVIMARGFDRADAQRIFKAWRRTGLVRKESGAWSVVNQILWEGDRLDMALRSDQSQLEKAAAEEREAAYEARVRSLEAEGATRSDAQAVAEAEGL